MPNIFMLDDPSTVERSLVGGKAAGLMRMMRGGIGVPPGFVVTTEAYEEFLESSGLAAKISRLIAGVDYGQAEQVEAATGEIRATITQAPLSAGVEADIAAAYGGLGDDCYVAVRSSGTAEDMGDASFAGLYDTYLDISGPAEVISAVRRCWASLWTARCASYRHRLGFGADDATVAVVVQRMIAADSAGVLFTANPLTERTDEMVVNSNWGLGESIASGIVTPDEFVVDVSTGAVKTSTLGSKNVRIVRAPGGGTVKQDVEEASRHIFSLELAEVSELAAIGLRVLKLAEGIPQDIEWARADGQFYLLQSRDITGARFLWEEDIEAWQTAPDDEDVIWSHTWAKAFWTGAVSPLFYSVRGRELRNSDERLFTIWGFEDLAKMRRFKYRRSTVYFSSDADLIYYRNVLPPKLRQHHLDNLPPDWRPEAAKASFGIGTFLRMHARVRALTSDQGPLRSIASVYRFFEQNSEAASKPSAQELRRYSDAELRSEIAAKMQMFEDYFVVLRPAFHIYSATAFTVLRQLLDDWYDGDNAYAFQDLISGLPQRTEMMQEQLDMWELADMIGKTPELRDELFHQESGQKFFATLEETELGREFLAEYEKFLAKHGHRGHQDRDLWYPRRSEDPQIDFQAFRALLLADAPSPEINEKRLIATREKTTEEVLARIGRAPLGTVRVEIVKLVIAYIHKFLVLRDDERPFADLVTMGKKRAFAELGRRLHERGLLARPDDYFFLAEYELYELMDGRAQRRLVEAKVANRRHVFERFLAREEVPPDYLKGNTPIAFDDGSSTDEAGVFQGVGMSRGSVTGTARIIRDLREMAKVEKGEILICNSTDPGWTPVFGMISGLVLESGGMLSHGACLSREYGLPAVTLANAMQRVPDGATITVDGDTGRLKVHSD
jgi:phosphohistidine swiveling domain-containing protein